MRLWNGFFLALLVFGSLTVQSQTKFQVFPEIQTHRRTDVVYLDSLSQVAKKRYQAVSAVAATPVNDTLRFRALYYLGRLYRIWYGRRDSTVYFGNELVKQARKSKNLYYELNGKLIVAEHYLIGELNTPLALRLNLDILAALPQNNAYYDVARHRTYMNLGQLYTIARDYDSALRYLKLDQQLLTHDLVYAGPATSLSFRIEVKQYLGRVYNEQNRFAESEKHYLEAEALLTPAISIANNAYIYDDLAELYLKYNRFGQALSYAKKAEAIWNQQKPANESKSWGTLACVYAGLGQNDLAYQYAQRVLQLPRSVKYIQEQAYKTLYQVFERRGDWKNSALYYKKYVAIRDTIAFDQHTLELVAIQKQVELDNIALEHQQAQKLQIQQLLTIQKEAELNQLRANVQAEALIEKAQLSEQQRRFDNEQAKTLMLQQQAAQRLQQQRAEQQFNQQKFQKQVLQQEYQTQQNLFIFLISSFLFVMGILILLLYTSNLRKRKAQAEAQLRLTRERQDANARIIQTQETERQRIAADLHDDLGGTLATLRRRLDDMRLRTTDVDTQRAFADAEPLIQKSSDDLRRISHNLMPPEFARIGLHDALAQLVRNQSLQPTQFAFVASGLTQKLPLDTELNAYRIVSELIQNINKHAQAKRAAVQLLYQNDHLTITVEDDGLGNRAIANMNESTGIGLKNSSLRAEYIGATLWRDVSEAGTLVVLDIPYPTPLYAARTSLPNSLN